MALTLEELINRLQFVVDQDRSGQAGSLGVQIPVIKPYDTIGGSPAVQVKDIRVGFDWDSGKIFLVPEQSLYVDLETMKLANRFADRVKNLVANFDSRKERKDRNLRTRDVVKLLREEIEHYNQRVAGKKETETDIV